MSLVIDSSVVVAALSDSGANGAWAEEVLQQSELHGPAHVFVEAANVLRRLERGNAITEDQAEAAFRDLTELNVLLHPFEDFAERIWELRHNVSIYDGWYVALAEALDAPLATLDGRLVKAKGLTCRFLTRPGAE